jgi:hypothetical protein
MATRLLFPYPRSEPLARTISWKSRIPTIRQRVESSSRETWTRRDIEDLFEIRRAAAQQLMRAVGSLTNVGGVYLVGRPALLRFLLTLEHADNPEAARRDKIASAEPAPRPRLLKVALPEELRSTMARDLPASITIQQGRITVEGADAEEVILRLGLLAQAMQNDLATIEDLLNPPPPPKPANDDELQQMFADLRQREQKHLRAVTPNPSTT